MLRVDREQCSPSTSQERNSRIASDTQKLEDTHIQGEYYRGVIHYTWESITQGRDIMLLCMTVSIVILVVLLLL